MNGDMAIIPRQVWLPGTLAEVESAILTLMSAEGGQLVCLYEVPSDVGCPSLNGHILLWDFPKISRVFFSRMPSVGDFLPVRCVLAETSGRVLVRLLLPASYPAVDGDPVSQPLARLVTRSVESILRTLTTEMTVKQRHGLNSFEMKSAASLTTSRHAWTRI